MRSKILLVLSLSAVLALSGCGGMFSTKTVVPPSVTPAAISYSGNTQNAGLIGEDGKGGFLLDTNAIAKYDNLLAKYGSFLERPRKAGDRYGITIQGENFSMTREVMADFLLMSQWRRDRKPPAVTK